MKKSIIRTGIALIFFFLLACGVSAKPGFYNLLEMEEVAVGLDTDGSGNLYALLGNGDIIKIDGNNKTETVYSGIDTGGFSWMAFSVLNDGCIVFSDSIDDKDAVFMLETDGSKKELVRFDHEGGILSLASDKKNRIYIGVWESEGNLTVVSNPNRISAAENIWGKIVSLDVNSPDLKTTVYNGGLPLALSVDKSGILFASIWGKKGYFQAESGEYSVVNRYHLFWVCFSKDIQVVKINEDDVSLVNSGIIYALSNLICREDKLLGFGLSLDDSRGIFAVSDTVMKMNEFTEEKTEGLLAAAYHNNVLYMANIYGEIFKYIF